MWWTRDVRLLFLGEMLFLLLVVVVLELKQLPGPVRLLELYELSSPVDIRQGRSPSELLKLPTGGGRSGEAASFGRGDTDLGGHPA